MLFRHVRRAVPDQEDLDTLPQPWKDLLGRCTAKKIDRRPKDFAAVLERLAGIQEPRAMVATPPPITTRHRLRQHTTGPRVTSPAAKTTPKPAPVALVRRVLRHDDGAHRARRVPHGLDQGADRQADETVSQSRSASGSTTSSRSIRSRSHGRSIWRRIKSRWGSSAGSWRAAATRLKLRRRATKRHWRNPSFAQGDDHPVVCVSHNDTVAFLGWLNEQETEKKRGYRLPTEAQWEYACRAGTGGIYGADDDPESLVRIANVPDASYKKVFPNSTCIRGDDGFVYTAPVGSFEPNAWHLYDMIGNVCEWCDDWFDPKFYQSSPREDPHNTAPASFRVIRGGSWCVDPGVCRPAFRSRRARRRLPGYHDPGVPRAAVQE